MTLNCIKQMLSKYNFMNILESTPKKISSITVRGASNLKGFNPIPILNPKLWKISKKIHMCIRYFHCAREAFMSMLMKPSRACAREAVMRTTTLQNYAVWTPLLCEYLMCNVFASLKLVSFFVRIVSILMLYCPFIYFVIMANKT